jgi:hypothetical protein
VPQPLAFRATPGHHRAVAAFNEIYVVERLLKSVSELDYPRERLQSSARRFHRRDQYLTASCAQNC